MHHSLKNLPDKYLRPSPPKPLRWIIALTITLVTTFLLMRFAGRGAGAELFWWLAVGVPAAVWFTAGAARLMIWLIKDVKANGFDNRRERWILAETRKARRALQVLNVSFITGHPQASQHEVLQALMAQQGILHAQPDWQGQNGQRLSRFHTEAGETAESAIRTVFSRLIDDLPLERLPGNPALAVAFAISSSVPTRQIVALWQEIWQETMPDWAVEYLTCNGLATIEHWLNQRFQQQGLLLVVALQVVPQQPHNSAEAAVALLLGNRLTQQRLQPLALLHRPDAALPGQLAPAMRMAAYHVPLQDHLINRLWLAGLSAAQHQEAMTHQQDSPAGAVDNDGVIALDGLIGQAGAAATWLAIAAAAAAAELTRQPQMTLTGEGATETLWSTVIAPLATQQETDT